MSLYFVFLLKDEELTTQYVLKKKEIKQIKEKGFESTQQKPREN